MTFIHLLFSPGLISPVRGPNVNAGGVITQWSVQHSVKENIQIITDVDDHKALGFVFNRSLDCFGI